MTAHKEVWLSCDSVPWCGAVVMSKTGVVAILKVKATEHMDWVLTADGRAFCPRHIQQAEQATTDVGVGGAMRRLLAVYPEPPEPLPDPRPPMTAEQQLEAWQVVHVSEQ